MDELKVSVVRVSMEVSYGFINGYSLCGTQGLV